MKFRKPLTALFFICMIFLSGLWWIIERNQAAPDVTFSTITGKKIVLKQLHGKPVLVTFWATDCPGCIEEIPHLVELYNDYHDKGLEMIAVAMFYDPPNHVVAMTKAKQLPYDVALDLQGINAKLFRDVRLTPSTFLISPDSKIVMHKTGSFDVQDMKQRIESMINLETAIDRYATL